MKKKITTELYPFRKVNQMCDFGITRRNAFDPGSAGANTLAALVSAVENLRIQTAAQASTENRVRALRRIKMEARTDLRQDMKLLYHTAHAVALEKAGFDDKFQSSLWGDPKLLNAARSAVRDAEPVAGVFISHAMPANFIEALEMKVRRLEQAREEHANGKTACELGEKELRESLRKAVAAARTFDAVMQNTFRNDPITLEGWKTACRLARVARKKEDLQITSSSPAPPDTSQTAQAPA